MELAEFFNRPKMIPQRSPKHFGHCQSLHSPDRPVKLLITGGTYYDKGYWYGFYMGHAMQLLNQSIYNFVGRIGLGVTHQKLTKHELYQHTLPIFKNLSEDRFQELQGIIDGSKEAGFPFEDPRDVLIVITFFELNEAACCSTSAIAPPLSSQHTYQINSSEYPFRFDFQKYPCVVLHFPQDSEGNRIGQATFITSYAGLIGGPGGINEKGVAYGAIRSSNLKSTPNPDGLTQLYVIDNALSQANTAIEMTELVKPQQKAMTYFFVVSDPHQLAESLNLWFYGHNLMETYSAGQMIDKKYILDHRYAMYEPITGGVYWMDMPTPGAEAGPEKVLESFKRYQGRIQDDEALKIAKEIGSRYTIISAVYNSTTLQAWVSYSRDRTPAHERDYIQFDLKTLFHHYEEFITGNFNSLTQTTSLKS